MMRGLREVERAAVLRHTAAAGLFVTSLVGAALWTVGNAKWGGALPRLELTILAILFAGIVASVAGFAFSAIAGALLIHLYPEPVEMVRILLVCSITIQAYCTLMVANSVRWRELAPYLAGGLLAAPVGVFLLMRVSSTAYGLALGVFLVAYGAYSLAKPVAIRTAPSRGLDAVVGALGGITGGLAAFPGAFTAMWCSARGFSKDAQRAICQPYIFFMQIVTLAMVEPMRPSGTGDLTSLWVFVPVSLLAASVGFRLFRGLSNAQFRVVLLTVLIASGAVLVLRSV